jgi:hypothetical protein
MKLTYQRGELSLFWAAVAVGVFALVCMVGLMSMRYERNYFMEAWKGFVKTDAGQVLQKTQAVAGSAVKGDEPAMRKCMVDGKVTYSNVDCDNKGQVVKIQHTAGIEAPKVPPAPAQQGEGKPGLQEKMIEKAIRQ